MRVVFVSAVVDRPRSQHRNGVEAKDADMLFLWKMACRGSFDSRQCSSHPLATTAVDTNAVEEYCHRSHSNNSFAGDQSESNSVYRFPLLNTVCSVYHCLFWPHFSFEVAAQCTLPCGHFFGVYNLQQASDHPLDLL